MLLKPALVATLALTIVPSVSQAQDLKADILANEMKVWQTFLGAHPDTAAFEQLATSDYLCIEANGDLMTKAENLDHLTFSFFKILDSQVRELSRSSALIVGPRAVFRDKGRQQFLGRDIDLHGMLKQGNKWVAKLHQETNPSDPKGVFDYTAVRVAVVDRCTYRRSPRE